MEATGVTAGDTQIWVWWAMRDHANIEHPLFSRASSIALRVAIRLNAHCAVIDRKLANR
jgi:hypothetical protein